MLTPRDLHLREKGFHYQQGGAYPENAEQISRLMKNGWQEKNDSTEDDYMRVFWKAIIPGYADIHPTEI